MARDLKQNLLFSQAKLEKQIFTFLREKEEGFIAVRILAKVIVNGVEIKKLVVKENISHSINEKYKIKIT